MKRIKKPKSKARKKLDRMLRAEPQNADGTFSQQQLNELLDQLQKAHRDVVVHDESSENASEVLGALDEMSDAMKAPMFVDDHVVVTDPEVHEAFQRIADAQVQGDVEE